MIEGFYYFLKAFKNDLLRVRLTGTFFAFTYNDKNVFFDWNT